MLKISHDKSLKSGYCFLQNLGYDRKRFFARESKWEKSSWEPTKQEEKSDEFRRIKSS